MCVCLEGKGLSPEEAAKAHSPRWRLAVSVALTCVSPLEIWEPGDMAIPSAAAEAFPAALEVLV